MMRYVLYLTNTVSWSLFSSISLKQQPKGRHVNPMGHKHVNPMGHIVLISGSTIYILSMKYTLYRDVKQLDLNTNCMLSWNLIKIWLLFQTYLIPPLFIEVPVSRQEREWWCMRLFCVLILPLSTNCSIGFLKCSDCVVIVCSFPFHAYT